MGELLCREMLTMETRCCALWDAGKGDERYASVKTCDWAVDVKLTLNEIFQMKFLKRSRFSAGFSWMINFTDICMAMNANHVCISRGEEGLSHNALNILASFNEKNAFNSFYICFRLGPSVYVNILILVSIIGLFIGAV